MRITTVSCKLSGGLREVAQKAKAFDIITNNTSRLFPQTFRGSINDLRP